MSIKNLVLGFSYLSLLTRFLAPRIMVLSSQLNCTNNNSFYMLCDALTPLQRQRYSHQSFCSFSKPARQNSSNHKASVRWHVIDFVTKPLFSMWDWLIRNLFTVALFRRVLTASYRPRPSKQASLYPRLYDRIYFVFTLNFNFVIWLKFTCLFVCSFICPFIR